MGENEESEQGKGQRRMKTVGEELRVVIYIERFLVSRKGMQWERQQWSLDETSRRYWHDPQIWQF